MSKYVFYNSYQDELTAVMSIGDLTATVASVGDLVTPAATEILYLTIVNPFDHTDYEIVQCTLVAGLIFTVTRGRESTTAKEWPIGSIVAARVTAGMLDEFPQGFDNGGDAKGFASVNLQPSRTSSDQVASGSQSIVAGYKTKATGLYDISIGSNSEAAGGAGGRAIAIGGYSEALSARQTAINQWTGDAGKTAEHALHINSYKYPTANYQRHLGGFEYIAPHFGEFSATVDEDQTAKHLAQEMIIYSDPINLGDSPTWAATTSYEHGDVIFPTVSNGKCYLCYEWVGSYFGSGTSGSTEPTWTTTVGAANTGDGDLSWICIDPTDYQFIMPDYLRFTPIEFGFIATTVSDTTQPFISFGINGNLTKWLASTQTTLLTGDYAAEMIKPTNSEGAKQFGGGLVTAGTGNYTGRLVIRGLITEILSA